jgi:hypothetical protein
MTALSTREMRDSLLGIECRCGRGKKGGMSLCRECWSRLPRDLGHRLYRLIGDGYEAAYTSACKWLDEDNLTPRVTGKMFGRTS